MLLGRHVLLLILATTFSSTNVLSTFCPQEEHAICNLNDPNRTCLCSLLSPSTEPPSKISCNQVVNPAGVHAISLQLSDESSLDNNVSLHFPEPRVRSAAAWALSVREGDLVFLRVRCVGENDTLIVQFAVLFGNASAGKNWTDRAAKRIGDVRSAFNGRIAPLRLISANSVQELISIEADANNFVLIIQAVVVLLFVVVSVLGAAHICKKQLAALRAAAVNVEKKEEKEGGKTAEEGEANRGGAENAGDAEDEAGEKTALAQSAVP